MSILDFESARQLLEPAISYVTVFTDSDEAAMKATYRRLMRVVHPDRVETARQVLANTLVTKLSAFYRDAQSAIRDRSFGSTPADAILTSVSGSHVVVGEMTRFCDITKGFRAKSDVKGYGELDTFIKIANSPRDNDLMAREAVALKKLHDTAGDEFSMFYPELVDSFGVMDGRMRLRANVVKFMDGFLNVEQLRHNWPDGLHPLDAAWIWRRLLWALGGAHGVGIVHGAVLPRHIIIHPSLHGVILVDWCYSAYKVGDTYPPLSAIVSDRRSWYPVDVPAKQPLCPYCDLVMAARLFCYLLGGDPVSLTMPTTVPALMARYIVDIVRGTQQLDAFGLLEQFDALLQTLGNPYYPRTYRKLVLK